MEAIKKLSKSIRKFGKVASRTAASWADLSKRKIKNFAINVEMYHRAATRWRAKGPIRRVNMKKAIAKCMKT